METREKIGGLGVICGLERHLKPFIREYRNSMLLRNVAINIQI